jgi:hypothetical protein
MDIVFQANMNFDEVYLYVSSPIYSSLVPLIPTLGRIDGS